MSETIKFYDIAGSDLVPRPLSESEVAALTEMFGSAGWKVFVEMRQLQAQECVVNGMDVACTEEERVLARADYKGCKRDTEFEAELKEAIDGLESVEFEAIAI